MVVQDVKYLALQAQCTPLAVMFEASDQWLIIEGIDTFYNTKPWLDLWAHN